MGSVHRQDKGCIGLLRSTRGRGACDDMAVVPVSCRVRAVCVARLLRLRLLRLRLLLLRVRGAVLPCRYGNLMWEFSTFGSAVESTLLMTIGDYDYQTLQ